MTETSIAAISPPSVLARRVAITLLLLAATRIPDAIPLPGVDLGLPLGSASPASLIRLSLGSLGVRPYVEAWLLVHLIHACMKFTGASVAGRLERAVRYLALALALVQGFIFGTALNHGGFVDDGAIAFRLTTALGLAVNVLFLIWLGDKITRHGIGHGIPLIIATPLMAALPGNAWKSFEMMRFGAASGADIVALLTVITATALATAFVARARYRLPVFPFGDGGARHLTLELVPAGFIAALCASMAAHVLNRHAPQLIQHFDPAFATFASRSGIVTLVLSPLVLLAAMMVFDPMVRDPADLAEALRRSGGTIAGLAPGQPAAARIQRLTLVLSALGGVLLALLLGLPDIVAIALHLRTPVTGGQLMLITLVMLACLERVDQKER